MSNAKATTFVLSLAILPPLLVVLRVFLNPLYLVTTPKTLLAVYLVLYVLAVTKITVPYFRSPLRGLPQPPGGSILFGHSGAEFKQPRGSAFLQWIDTVPNSGLIFFRGFLQGLPRLLLTTPEALQEVLVGHPYDFEKPALGRVLVSRTTGRGLITVEGTEHKVQRKSVTPAFSGKQIKDLVPVFWSKSQAWVNHLADQLDTPAGSEKKGREGVLEINSWASRVTLDIIGVACVGRDFGAIYNANDEFVQQYDKILQTTYGNIVLYGLLSLALPLHIARWFPLFKRFRDASEGRYQLRPLCRRLVAIKRQDMQTESEKHIDILSVLIRSGQFTDDGLVDQLLTFLAAGHETTSGALTWTCWLLATYPSVQQKLRAELHAYLSSHSAIDSASLEALPYLSAVTSEQLRLWPTVPNTGREVVRDTTILGQFVPKGTFVNISPWAVNRSTKLWGPDAGEFKPERWMPDGQASLGGSKSSLSLITFLHGPRSCIGQAFSRAELKCLVASMVTKFEIQMADLDEVIEPGGFVTIKPKNGMRLRLREL